jgi:putative SOS response-associated peptidase YedK
MCGRYTLSTPAGRLAEEFQLDSTVEIPPNYNVAPTQQVAAVLEDEGGGVWRCSGRSSCLPGLTTQRSGRA